LIYTAGARLRHLGLVALPALVGLAGLLIFVPFRLRRMIMFLDPWADPQGSGFQVVQSLIAIGSGGPNGLGFAQGKQKMLFLPFAHSDFIFAVIGEELGLLGTLTVLLVFALFLWRGIRTSLLAPASWCRRCLI
jgi:cell division protein FtsW